MSEFSWPESVNKFLPSLSEQLAQERGINPVTIEWLQRHALIGACYVAKWKERCVAFPICNENGEVFRAHCRSPQRNGEGKWDWTYEPFPDPLHRSVSALLFGSLPLALRAFLFESQWDALALIDKLNLTEEIDSGEACVIVTRGAQNATRQLASFKWPADINLYAFPQRDDAGQEWLGKVLDAVGGCYVVEIPQGLDGVKDLNEWTLNGATAYDLEAAIEHAELRKPDVVEEPAAPPQVMIEFLRPSQVIAYEPPPGIVLVGDNHIVRDAVFVLAGAPGVGKSRLLVWLARCGALGVPWMGYDVHVQFRTLIIQNENGRYRLKLEFTGLNCPQLEDYLLITPPPPFGLCFDRAEFRDQLKMSADIFQPQLVVIDPWNAAARDDRQKDYLDTFNDIRSVFPPGFDGPSIGIAAHTRKPYPNERSSGRALLNLLAGSYVLGSIPRSVWVVQAASDNVADERIVLTCCKNNDGELGPRSPWARRNNLFVPVTGFDWDEFDHPSTHPQKLDGTIEDLFGMIPVVKPITRDELNAKAAGKISRDNVRDFLAELLRNARIFIHKVPNPVTGFRSLVGYAKTAPQNVDTNVDIDDDTDNDTDIEDDPR